MSINEYLINDIFDYIFNKTDIINIVTFSRVCKLWYDVIMLKSIRCTICNKIINLYSYDLYATDVYCLMCHGRPLNAGKYEILNYKIQNIKMLQTIVNFLDEGYLYMSLNKYGIQLKQRNATNFRNIEIAIFITADIYTFKTRQINLNINNTQIRQLINLDNIQTSEISVYNVSDQRIPYLKINTYQTKLLDNICKNCPTICNCRVRIRDTSLDPNIRLNSIEFNKLCMSLTMPYVNIEINNGNLKFIEADVKNNAVYVSKDILSISEIGLLSNNLVLYYDEPFALVFTVVINKTIEIKIAECKRYWFDISWDIKKLI